MGVSAIAPANQRKKGEHNMKTTLRRLALALSLSALLGTPALAEAAPVTDSRLCYPTSVTQSEDGLEIRKAYDLSPEEDPAGIPRSDFEQEGVHYTVSPATSPTTMRYSADSGWICSRTAR